MNQKGRVRVNLDFATHAAATRLADIARRKSLPVRRSAGRPSSRSAYVFVGDLKIRVADHPPSRRERGSILDVYVAEPRPGAVSISTAIKLIAKGKPNDSYNARIPALA